MLRSAVCLGVIALLSGCAGMEDDSTCTKIDGISGCASINDVNTMVNQGDIRSDNQGNVYRSYDAKSTDSDEDKAARNAALANAIRIVPMGRVNHSPKNSDPQRTGERVITMTIFPFQDSNEAYHDTSIIHFIYSKPHWNKPAVTGVRKSEDDE